MTAELDQVLLKVDRIQRVHDLLRSYGASEQQASVGSVALADKFTWNGTMLSYNEGTTGTHAVDDPKCREKIAAEYHFLLPPPDAKSKDDVVVDPALLASAKAGNKTAYGKIFVQLGKDKAATDALIAEKPADESADDVAAAAAKAAAAAAHAKNPWSAAGWSLKRQGEIVRALGVDKAAALARAVQSRIGATRPTV